jgi:hypothetical protein
MCRQAIDGASETVHRQIDESDRSNSSIFNILGKLHSLFIGASINLRVAEKKNSLILFFSR